MNKGIVLGMVILVIGMSFTGTSYSLSMSKSKMLSFDGNILYVGGNGTGNYSKIQDAIDDAVDGDTVFVFDDSSPYYENVVIDKSINLIGEDRNTTIIDGDNHGDVIFLSSNWVTIRGFTIQNSGEQPYEDAGIDINSSYNTITDNNILDNYCGIATYLLAYYDLCYTIISDNNINSNNYDGIHLSDSDSNTIADNEISNNYGDGIYLGSCNGNTIAGNYISSNNENGMYIPGCSHNNIKGNVIISNTNNGLYLSGKKNTIVGNHITSNDNIGINLQGRANRFTGLGNTILGNNITSNNGTGIYVHKGRINYILKNNFIDNEQHAFFDTAFFNRWDKNYWEGDEEIPVRINGMISFYRYDWQGEIIWELHIPWENYDRQPAKEPYNITTAQGCGIE